MAGNAAPAAGSYHEGMRVLLVSTYELGRQPFGLASPAAWLREAGFQVETVDVAVERLEPEPVREARLVCFYLPMHTATRIAVPLIDRVREIRPEAHLCAFGLYAPVNRDLLRRHGVRTVLGGEFEAGLVALARRLEAQRPEARRDGDGRLETHRDETGREAAPGSGQPEPTISLERQEFRVPDRSGLPSLERYAHLHGADGERRVVGYTEASRGCKHLCRHCPIVPVYGGRFRVVQPEVVLADVRQQVEAGAEHITFGDPDFLNGPAHARRIVEDLHREFPEITYDVTVKVEHLLERSDLLPVLRDTGCAFVTSAVESVDDRVLEILDKGHTRDDFHRLVELFRDVGLVLQPTFVAFTPWISLKGYRDLLRTIAELDLVDNVPPIQLAIRLLIPAGSRLLELPETRAVIEEFDEEALTWRWSHPDPRVEALQERVEEIAAEAALEDRRSAFQAAWEAIQGALELPPELPAELPAVPPGRPRATIPYLSEPWYC